MTIYEDSKVTVVLDSSVPCIIWTPLQFMKGAEWQIPFTKGVDFLSQQITSYPTITWLNDTRKLKMVGLDDLGWLNKNVNDRCFKLGLKKVAFVLPDNIFGKMAVKFYVEYTNKRSDNLFQIKAFSDYDEAVKWLSAKSNINVEEVRL